MVHYKLHYFNLGARAEFIRQIFAQAGVEYEDFRIPVGDQWQQWRQLKSNYPNGQVPVLEVDGKVLAQTYAIGRFLAKQFGVAGKYDWEAAQADMHIYDLEDLWQKMHPVIIALVRGEGDKDEELAKVKPTVLEPFLVKYEQYLKDNGGQYFVGNELTWADIAIADVLDRLTWIDAHILDGHTSLKEYLHRIHNLPNIKKHNEARPKMVF
uniref:glutathione transferase n=1 Tax=Plectus sambesii TaxID=2011161 RepID=A0A914V2Z8_9BILA